MNKLNTLFRQKRDKPLLAAHFIVGYPTLTLSLEIGEAMIRGGASILEIQIPFSDPSADGPVIVEACHKALAVHVRAQDALSLAAKLGKEHGVPIVMVSYANPIFCYGITRFIEDVAKAGVSGVIIPDLPIDTEEGKEFVLASKKVGVHPILLVSPGVPEKRLSTLLKEAAGFVYSTSRQGITGANSLFATGLPDFISSLRRYTDIPIAVGFGVKSHKDFLTFASYAEIVAVGSMFVSIINSAKEKNISIAVEEAVRKLVSQ